MTGMPAATAFLIDGLSADASGIASLMDSAAYQAYIAEKEKEASA